MIVVIAHNDISFVVEIAKLRKLEFVEESSLYRDPGPLTCCIADARAASLIRISALSSLISALSSASCLGPSSSRFNKMCLILFVHLGHLLRKAPQKNCGAVETHASECISSCVAANAG